MLRSQAAVVVELGFQMGSQNVLCWNVRGLNARSHRDSIRELVMSEHVSLICLQETKMSVISDYDVVQILGLGFDYFYLPAVHTRGGILVTWHSASWVVTNMSSRCFSVSLCVRSESRVSEWWLSSIYGPTSDEDKPTFLEELHELSQVRYGPWMLCGDFNMVYRVQDKNNDRLDRRMGQFRRFLNVAALKELHLEGRLFTWSNERAHPTLEKIDRFFITAEWGGLFPNHDLHAMPTLCSDHTLLLLHTDVNCKTKKRFMFRAFWPKLHGFRDVVARAWHCPLSNANPFCRLDWLVRNIVRVLQSWNNRKIDNIRMQLAVAKEVLQQIQVAWDFRPLAPHEENLRQFVKLKTLGLASLQRILAR
jgi:exonuclease III